MDTPSPALRALLASLQPTLHAGTYVYACLAKDHNTRELDPVATFREDEGLTIIVEEDRARQEGLSVLFRAAWITLQVASELEAVGLTAAVATALTRAGISCNVAAAAHHDHLFVPIEAADRAMQALQSLQANAAP